MNIKQANEIKIADILRKLGVVPAKQKGKYVWFNSPFRQENEASFMVDIKKNTWIDWGLIDSHKKGGNPLDFIQIYYQTSSVKEALRYLRELLSLPQPEYREKIEKIDYQDTEKAVFELISTKPLEEKMFLQYLTTRKINLDIAKRYLEEVHYLYKFKGIEKEYSAIGLKNISGGYDIRSKYIKGSVGKDITIINCFKNIKQLTVFEGMMDFLSCLTFFDKEEWHTPICVMNATTMVYKLFEYLEKDKLTQLFLYLDNDKSGQETTVKIKEKFPQAVDCSGLYKDSNDFNEFLMAQT